MHGSVQPIRATARVQTPNADSQKRAPAAATSLQQTPKEHRSTQQPSVKAQVPMDSPHWAPKPSYPSATPGLAPLLLKPGPKVLERQRGSRNSALNTQAAMLKTTYTVGSQEVLGKNGQGLCLSAATIRPVLAVGQTAMQDSGQESQALHGL